MDIDTHQESNVDNTMAENAMANEQKPIPVIKPDQNSAFSIWAAENRATLNPGLTNEQICAKQKELWASGVDAAEKEKYAALSASTMAAIPAFRSGVKRPH